jgi:hypothetical protein
MATAGRKFPRSSRNTTTPHAGLCERMLYDCADKALRSEDAPVIVRGRVLSVGADAAPARQMPIRCGFLKSKPRLRLEFFEHVTDSRYRCGAHISGAGILQVLAKHALAGAFESEEVKILTDAFDQAWQAVEQSGVCFSSDAYKNATRELLALRTSRPHSWANATPVGFAMMPFCFSPERTSRAPAYSIRVQRLVAHARRRRFLRLAYSVSTAAQAQGKPIRAVFSVGGSICVHAQLAKLRQA